MTLVWSVLLTGGLVIVNVVPIGPFVTRGAATPEEAIRNSITLEQNRNFKVVLRKSAPSTFDADFVIYTSQSEYGDGVYLALVERRRYGWYYESGSGFGVPSRAGAQWIDYYEGIQQGDSGSYYALYGRVISPSVRTIEVSFTNGQVVRAIPEHGFFIVVVIGNGISSCVIRAFDVMEQELTGITPDYPYEPPPDPRCISLNPTATP